MQSLLTHFKERPKTAAVLLLISLMIASFGWYRHYEEGDWEMPGMMRYAVNPSIRESDDGDWYAADEKQSGSPFGGARGVATIISDQITEHSTMPPMSGETAAEVEQKIIRTSSLDLIVQKTTEAAARVEQIAKEHRGFVQSSSVNERGNGVYAGQVVLRVPVEAFDAAMASLRSIATLVRNESSSGQDVTEQYTDLEAQLRNAKAQEETYLQVLKQAKSVEDILKVQERLGTIRAQIESLEGRIQYLKNATSYATISVSLSEEPAVRAPTKEFRPLAVIKAAFQALVIVLQNLIVGLIWVVIVWGGILLPIGAIVWLVRRWWKARRRVIVG